MQQEPLHGLRVRAVTIELKRNTYFVKYVTRTKGQHHSAAQFYAGGVDGWTLEKVRRWVADQQHLALLD